MSRPVDVAALVSAHHATIWRYLRYLGCDRALADDLTQDTFVQLLQAPPEERTPTQSAAWLRTVARNLFLMHLRKAKRQGGAIDLDLNTVVDEGAIEDADAAWIAGRADDGDRRQDALHGCLERVQPNAREALVLQVRDGLSGEQIAQRLGMSHQNVRVTLHRARDVLKSCIENKLQE